MLCRGVSCCVVRMCGSIPRTLAAISVLQVWESSLRCWAGWESHAWSGETRMALWNALLEEERACNRSIVAADRGTFIIFV